MIQYFIVFNLSYTNIWLDSQIIVLSYYYLVGIYYYRNISAIAYNMTRDDKYDS